ncbi:MAG: hypothetical protein HC875_19805 [Anaerolineales bacterium]|nr:hypothetical protein [Anaerolineales bacterium]
MLPIIQALDSGNGNKSFFQDLKEVDKLPDSFFCLSFHQEFKDKDFFACYLFGEEEKLLKNLDKHLVKRFNNSLLKKKSFLNSFKNSNFDLKNNNFWSFVPLWFKQDFLEIENEIIKEFAKTPVPLNYSFLKTFSILLNKISKRSLCIQEDLAEKDKFKKTNNYIRYNLFGTITGRLTTFKNSFPIMTFDKKERKILKPKNRFFVEMDYNGAEIRTLFNLIGKKIEEDDVYDFFAKQIGLSKNREEIKKETISWLYNPNSFNLVFDSLVNKEEVIKQFYKGDKIITPFNREVFCDKEHALNYLLQSTTSDICLEQCCKIDDFLVKNKMKTFISFVLHDCVVLDFDESEMKYLKNIKQIFDKNARIGDFNSNIKIGENYGEMKKITL